MNETISEHIYRIIADDAENTSTCYQVDGDDPLSKIVERWLRQYFPKVEVTGVLFMADGIWAPDGYFWMLRPPEDITVYIKDSLVGMMVLDWVVTDVEEETFEFNSLAL